MNYWVYKCDSDERKGNRLVGDWEGEGVFTDA
jgi:hypothetical protein